MFEVSNRKRMETVPETGIGGLRPPLRQNAPIRWIFIDVTNANLEDFFKHERK
jgi:hypothetical protein